MSLRSYYLRRLTRLEPPYIVAMLFCFLLIMYRHYLSADWHEYVSSFFASLFYSHNFIWPRGTLPLINPVAWSLEIEVQFYIVAPLIAHVYRLQKPLRRGVLFGIILAHIFLFSGYQLPHQTVLDYCGLFLMGFLLADLYVSGELKPAGMEWLYCGGAILAFAAIWLGQGAYLAVSVGLFYVCSLKSRLIRKALSNRWITTIGGMCYSIYLTHWMIMTTFGSRIVRKFTDSYTLDFVIHASLLMVVVLFVGAVYFKFIEQPCMNRDWPKQFAVTIARNLRAVQRLASSRSVGVK